MSDLLPAIQQAPQNTAIDERFSDEAKAAFITDLRRDLDLARSNKVQIDERITRYREYYSLDRPAPAYEGAPNHRVPYLRAKVAGATAHFRAALDQDPFFVTRPYTEEAAQNQGPWETMMERELDRSGTRRQIWQTVQEACLTGTGVLQLSITQPYDEPLIQAKAVRLEDFSVIPVGVDDISKASTFYRFIEPWHIVLEKFRNGDYDEEALDKVKQEISHYEKNFDERQDGTASHATQGDSSTREMYECYYRWGSDEHDIPHTLWRVIFNDVHNVALRIEESPYLEAFDAPPYVPIKPQPRINYMYGESYAQVLEGIQNIMDFAYNAKLAYDQLAVSPIVFVDMDSEAFQAIETQKGLSPGMVVPVRGDPQQSVYALPMPQATEAMNLLQTARALGEDATFSDLQLNGIPTNTVRSATEINAMSNAATKKLSEDLSNISHGLSQFARMYWSLIYRFKIEGRGVMPVFKGSSQYLIAAEEIGQDELLERAVEFMAARSGLAIPPEAIPMMKQIIEQQFAQQGIELFISSAARDDMEWLPNGKNLIPDKLQRANKMERLMSTLIPALQVVRIDGSAWHIFKAYLEALDIHNWRDILPPEPPEGQANPEQMAQFAQFMQQTKQGGGSGS